MKTACFIITLTLFIAGTIAAASSDSATATQNPAALVRDGNSAYEAGQFAEAETLYDSTLRERPESVEAKFNLANARFKLKKLDDARSLYLDVVESPTSSGLLRRRALYNLGNTAYQAAEIKLKDGDQQGAVESFREAVEFYNRTAGEDERYADSLADDARWNIEVTRLRIKQILDEIKRQQEQQQQQDDQNKEFQEKLDKAIDEQRQISEQADPNQREENQDTEQQSKRQQENLDRTKELSQELSDRIEQAAQAEQQGAQSEQQDQVPQNVRDARDQLDESQAHQAEAAEHMRREKPEDAQESAQRALEQLEAARDSLAQDQQQQQQQQPQNQNNEQNAQQQPKQQPEQDAQQNPNESSAQNQPREQRGEARQLSKEEAQRLLEEFKHNQEHARAARIRELKEEGVRLLDQPQDEPVTRDW